MRVVGIVGRSGSGKTTLIELLLPLLRARGLRVSTVKRTHHSVDIDPASKDSRRHREAGAEEVILAGEKRWALMRETPDVSFTLPMLLERLSPVDLVLVEGFGGLGAGPRLEVVRRQILALPGKQPLFRSDPAIDVVASDQPLPDWTGSWLDLNDSQAICHWIASVSPHPVTAAPHHT